VVTEGGTPIQHALEALERCGDPGRVALATVSFDRSTESS
jgi:hypothetical protein